METTIPNGHIHNMKRDDYASVTSFAPASSVDQHHFSTSDHAMSSNSSSSTINNDLPADAYCGGVSEIIEIMEEDEEASITSCSSSSRPNKNNTGTSMINGTLRMEQLTPISEGGTESNTTSLFSIDIHNYNVNSRRSSDEVVYVAVGKSESSMNALLWTLKHYVQRGSTLVYLIHIFSEIKFIPSPFGGGVVPKTQVSPDLVEGYLMKVTRKRRELLTKYVDICTLHLVQVETVQIESDSVANAIQELISVLNMRQLVLGISKSNLRKLKAGKGSATVAGQIRESARDQGCELTIVYQGKQLNMSEYFGIIRDPHLHSTSATSSGRDQLDEQQPVSYGPFACCFKA